MKPSLLPFPPALAASVALSISAGTAASAAVDFNRDVRPILNQHCTACHGGVKQAGNVSFTQRDKALASGKSGKPTVVAGKPGESELLHRVLLPDGDEDRMPPTENGKGRPLNESEIATLRQWIAEGAQWGEHWSLVPPRQPPLPAVQNAAWVRSNIDRFILHRLEQEGLKPSAPADPAQWLRRVTFDLTGLPPTDAERTRFSAGLESPEEAVDRLLASPHFGERWAALWLDLARYADTQGYEKDNGREIWPWRDWLVRSLNNDLPFDEFTVRTLAGDLLPDASIEDRVATGFHRNTQTNTEGGTDDEEFRLSAVIDRINTTWTVWQGTTFGCVQCHSHPYDAYRHDDYYRFLALWNSTEDADMGDDYPRLRVPTDPTRYAEAQQLDSTLRDLRARLNDAARPLMASESWKPIEGFTITGPTEARFDVNGNEVRVEGTVPNGAAFTVRFPAGTEIGALRLDILPRKSDPKQWPEHGAVVGHTWLEIEDPLKVAAAKIEAVRIDAENKAQAEADARAAEEAKKNGTKPPPKREPKPLPTGLERIEFVAVYADTLSGPYDPEESLKPGWAGGGAFPKLFGPRWLVFVPKTPAKAPPGSTLRLVLKHEIFDAETKGSIVRHFKLSSATSPAWSALVNSAERQDLRKQHAEARARRDAIPSASTLVMHERPTEARRETRVFVRGNFLAKDKVVEPGVPSVLPPLPPGEANRLAAARWLVSPSNPLTARVYVNRIWAELFGIGIVETLEDFGSTGTVPSHPELLDALAVQVQSRHHWSLKSFLRELTLSATYAQDHRATPELLTRDPRNRLLARGPRTRLTAEMVRDQALAAAGLLSSKVGGPPVMPPQPDGIWQVVYNGSEWVTPKNDDRYRRGLYTYWRRTSPYPSFLTFDASSREVCTARRVVTSTPLQALVTLNDPVYFEAAQALARRMHAAADSLNARLAWGWRRVLGEEPRPADTARLAQLHGRALDRYRADEALARQAGGTPDDAALTLVASTLLNLDKALTK